MAGGTTGIGDNRPTVFVAILVFIAWVLTYGGYFPNPEGRLGHDYERYLAQLLDGTFWVRVNGYFEIPWFTPSFCAGLPKFGHPNGIYVSLPQWLTLLVGPLLAVKLTVIGAAAAGYAGMWLLLRRAFGVEPVMALTGAVLFLWNGFYVHRMLVGHLTFHAYMLLPLQAYLLHALAEPGAPVARRAAFAAGLALTAAYQFTSGMVHLVGPVALALVGIVCLLARDEPRRLMQMILWGIGCAALALALVAAPLTATLAFLSHFNRDLYTLPGFTDPLAHVWTGLSVLFGRADAATVQALLANRALPVEIQELEYGLSPVPVVLMLAGLAGAGLPRMRGRSLAIVGCALVLLVPFALNQYGAGWNAWLKSLPLFASSSNLLRWYAAWIPLVIVLSILLLRRVPRARHPALPLAATLFVMVFQTQTADPLYAQQRYDPGPVEHAWATVTRPEITEVHPVRDLTAGASQAYCRDDFFGYRMETFPFRQMWEGAPTLEREGVFNMKHPACYGYPAENACTPGDNFRLGDSADLKAFVRYAPIGFEVNAWQRLANVLSMLGLVSVGGVLVIAGIGTLRARTVSNGQERGDA